MERKRTAIKIEKELDKAYLMRSEEESETVCDESDNSHHAVKYRKIAWTKEENALLTDLVLAYGDSAVLWHELAKNFPNHRSAKRCRERWVEYLDPALSTADFTAHEDQLIIRYQMQYGNKWKKMSNLLRESKRSSTAIKARWHQLQREDKLDNAPTMFLYSMPIFSAASPDTMLYLPYNFNAAIMHQQFLLHQQQQQLHPLQATQQVVQYPIGTNSNSIPHLQQFLVPHMLYDASFSCMVSGFMQPSHDTAAHASTTTSSATMEPHISAAVSVLPSNLTNTGPILAHSDEE